MVWVVVVVKNFVMGLGLGRRRLWALAKSNIQLI